MISYVATRSTCVFYNLPGFSNAQWMTFLKRLSRLSCSQCILQCTYSAGNNWSVCTNGTGGLGFWRTSRDIQATADSIFVCGVLLIFSFRACSDIKIPPSLKRKRSPSKFSIIILNLILCCLRISLSRLPPYLTTQLLSIDLNQFEDYYDELLVEGFDNINAIDGGN